MIIRTEDINQARRHQKKEYIKLKWLQCWKTLERTKVELTSLKWWGIQRKFSLCPIEQNYLFKVILEKSYLTLMAYFSYIHTQYRLINTNLNMWLQRWIRINIDIYPHTKDKHIRWKKPLWLDLFTIIPNVYIFHIENML